MDEIIDLDTAGIYDMYGNLITQQVADDLVEAAHRLPGRPSLTAPGERSPVITARVSADLKRRLAAAAVSSGRPRAAIVRDALDEYLVRTT